MPLWRRKRTVSIDTYCQEYYDTEVFLVQPPTAIPGCVKDWRADAQESLTIACPQIRDIERRLFQRELSAARLELFAIAWLDEFERGQPVLPHSEFTQRYLHQIGRGDVWASMGQYNEAIARAGILKEDGVDEKRASSMDRMRSDLLSQWVRKGFDRECVLRVANRLMTRIEPGSKALDLLATRFLDCTGRSQDQATALLPVSGLMFGFYKEARDTLSGVNLREGLSFKWF